MRVSSHCLHDGAPVQVEWSLGIGDVNAIKPLFNSIKRFDGDGVNMGWWAVEVLVDEDEIEVLEAELR